MANENILELVNPSTDSITRSDGVGVTYTNGEVYRGKYSFPFVVKYDSALRFQVPLAKNTTVLSAKIRIIIDGKSTGDNSNQQLKTRIYGLNTQNCPALDSSTWSIGLTSSYVDQANGINDVGSDLDFPVTNQMNEILARSDWSTNNYMGFRLDDNGTVEPYSIIIHDDPTVTSFLYYKTSSDPDFTPTPVSVTAPTVPAKDNYGVKISFPGYNVLDNTLIDSRVFYTSGKSEFKIHMESYYQSVSADITAGYKVVAHNLGYVPFTMVHVKSSVFGGGYKKLPVNWAFEDHPSYMIDDTNLYLHSAIAGEEFYYRIFSDQLE